jgi:hypothetical protein
MMPFLVQPPCTTVRKRAETRMDTTRPRPAGQ